MTCTRRDGSHNEAAECMYMYCLMNDIEDVKCAGSMINTTYLMEDGRWKSHVDVTIKYI